MRKTAAKRVLEACRETGPILSVYVDVDRGRKSPEEVRIDLKNLAKDAARAVESLPEEGRRLREAFEEACSGFPAMETRPAWGIFLSEKGILERVPLPSPVTSSVRLAQGPWLFPLLSALAPHREALLCDVGARRTRFYEIWGDVPTLLWEMEEPPQKRDRDPGRFPKEGEEEARKSQDRSVRHAHSVAVRARELFQDRSGLQVIWFAGPRALCEEAAGVAEGIPVEILDPIAGEGAEPLLSAIRGHVMRHFWDEGEALVRRIRAEAPRGGAALGWRSVLSAASRGAIHQLVVEEAEEVRGRSCRHCGALGLDEPFCPICRSATDPEEDLLEALLARTLEKEGEAVILGRPSALRDSGGVGALLRFAL
jgi:peptide chain release factor subunit 1